MPNIKNIQAIELLSSVALMKPYAGLPNVSDLKYPIVVRGTERGLEIFAFERLGVSDRFGAFVILSGEVAQTFEPVIISAALLLKSLKAASGTLSCEVMPNALRFAQDSLAAPSAGSASTKERKSKKAGKLANTIDVKRHVGAPFDWLSSEALNNFANARRIDMPRAELDPSIWLPALKLANRSMSSDEARINIYQISINRVNAGATRILATDAHRAIAITLDESRPFEAYNINMPGELVQLLAKRIKDVSRLAITRAAALDNQTSGHWAGLYVWIVEIDRVTFVWSSNLEPSMPPIGQIMNPLLDDTLSVAIELDASELQNLLRQAMVIAPSHTKTVTIEFHTAEYDPPVIVAEYDDPISERRTVMMSGPQVSPHTLSVSSWNPELGNFRGEMDIANLPPIAAIGMNAGYLKDAIELADSSVIQMRIKLDAGDIDPIAITNADASRAVIVMPMRI